MKRLQQIVWIAVIFSIPFTSIASVEVVGSLKHKHPCTPGDIIKGEIKVQNSDDVQQEIRIYQTDLLYNFEDYTVYDEDESHKRSNRTWVEFSPKTAILQAHEVRYIQYEIRVPEGDSICGTYWSVIMVQGVDPIDPEESGELTIKTVTRYAIQMITETSDRGEGLLEFLKPTLIQEGQKLILAVDIVNKGERYISPNISMELFDEQGNSVKKITASSKGLFPTTSARFRLDLTGLKNEQTYQCLIVAAGKDEDVFGLEYTLYL